jgi:hypothetical protein
MRFLDRVAADHMRSQPVAERAAMPVRTLVHFGDIAHDADKILG